MIRRSSSSVISRSVVFTYLDPSVRARLEADGKLVQIDAEGRPVEHGSEAALALMGPIPLPQRLGDLELTAQWYVFVRRTELAQANDLADQLGRQGGRHLFASLVAAMAVNSVLVVGDGLKSERPLVRIHSCCMTGDVFGSQRCECGPQLAAALERMSQSPDGGLVVYMAGHEGRGIGLWAKAATYLLQDAGEDTYQANRSLGLPDDSRDFTDAAIVLRHLLGDAPFRLLTNNPSKVEALRAYGIEKVEPERHVVGVGVWNRRYLSAKRDWGHRIEPDDLDASAAAHDGDGDADGAGSEPR